MRIFLFYSLSLISLSSAVVFSEQKTSKVNSEMWVKDSTSASPFLESRRNEEGEKITFWQFLIILCILIVTVMVAFVAVGVTCSICSTLLSVWLSLRPCARNCAATKCEGRTHSTNNKSSVFDEHFHISSDGIHLKPYRTLHSFHQHESVDMSHI